MSHRFQRIRQFNHAELHPYPSQYNPCRKITVRLHPLLVGCCLPVGGVKIRPIGRGIPLVLASCHITAHTWTLNWGVWARDRCNRTTRRKKSSPRRTHCKLWVCFFAWDLEGTGADIEILYMSPVDLKIALTCTVVFYRQIKVTTNKQTKYMPNNASSTSELWPKSRVPYNCITGYDTATPTLRPRMTSNNNSSAEFKCISTKRGVYLEISFKYPDSPWLWDVSADSEYWFRSVMY